MGYTVIRPAAVLVLCALLAGCGFQLRGATGISDAFKSVELRVADIYVREEIKIFMQQDGVKIIERGTDPGPEAVLQVGAEQFDRRVLSVNPDTGKAREYELAYVFNYRLVGGDGTALVAPGQIRLVRDYIFDADRVLGTSREEAVLREEMRRDAVQQLLRRISAGLRA